jgi:hypothetical protein
VSKGVCEICGKEIGAVESSAVPITGWVSERKGGGANAVIGKVVIPNRVAHTVCLKSSLGKAKRGHVEGQMSL